MTRVIDMTKGRPAKLMLQFAFPVVLTNLGQQLYSIVDAVIVGRGVGVDALAAVGCTDWTYWLILWSMSVMTSGFATFVSRFFGERDYNKMNRSILIAAVLSAVIAIILTVAGLWLAKPLLIFLGTPDEILGQATIYLSTMIAGTLIMTAYNLSASILRALGDGKTPLTAMILSAVINIALDLFLVMLLKWGVFGAALASVLAQLLAFLYCLVKIRTIEYIRLDRSVRNWTWKQVEEILFFGMPLALQYVVINISGMIVQSTINNQGSSFIAGYTAVNKLYGLLECSAIAMGNAFITFASQNYGARNFKRVRKGVNTAMILAVGASLLMMIIVLPLNRELPLLFMDVGENGVVESLDVASRYLVNMTISMPILYLVYVHRNNLQAIGVSSWSLVSGIAEAAARVIMAKVIFRWLGVDVLFFIEPFAWLLAWLFVMVPFYFYQRKRLPYDTRTNKVEGRDVN